VLADDLDRLEEMEFLNDTIIDYYMRCVVGN
jgi:Ulp1 family protease